ncbi:MAG: TRZ/ATZ family protein [bacterium]|nr:TRZ/ATZ family protein [bacterium]
MINTNWKKMGTTFTEEEIGGLRAGDRVLLSGVIYTARDKAHERLCRMQEQNKELPFELKGSILYYVGPSPTPQGKIIGSAGPTTSYRMDPFTETMLKLGVKGMIGKGKRGREVKTLISEYHAVYFSSFGGAGAFLSKRISAAEVVAFDDLGPEAIYKLTVKDFPVIVINDSFGGDLYEDAIRKRSGL